MVAVTKNLFVDSNIFLEFYHFSSEDLDALKKLSKLIVHSEITLLLTQQVIDEVERNRDNKVWDAFKTFRNSKPKIRFPQICKSYPQYSTVKREAETLEKAFSELDSKLNADISLKKLKADKIITALFKVAQHVPCEDLVEAARTRVQLGNPPGKKNSYGDAINWEALLNTVSPKKDLYFISSDRDYKSALENGQFNSFLLREWRMNKKSELHYYISLSEFFRDHYASIQLQNEIEKETLIAQLIISGAFASTHTTIAKLAKFDDFSDQQIEQLIDAALENPQISLIANDSDVLSFYRRLTKNRIDFLDKDILVEFNALFYEEEIS